MNAVILSTVWSSLFALIFELRLDCDQNDEDIIKERMEMLSTRI